MATTDVRKNLLRSWSLSYLIIMIIPLMLFVVLAMTSIYMVRSSVDKANRTALASVANELNSAMRQVDAVCEELLLSDSFRVLDSAGSVSGIDPYSLYVKTTELRHMIGSQTYLSDCILYSSSKDFYLTSQYYGRLSEIHENDVLDVPISENLADKLFTQYRNYTYIQDVSQDSVSGLRDSRILVVRPLSFVGSQNIGDFCVAALVDISNIFRAGLEEGYNLVIFDEETDEILFDYGKAYTDDFFSVKLRGVGSGTGKSIDDTFILATDSSVRGIRYFLIADEQAFFKDLYSVIRIVAVLLAAAILISLMVIHRLVSRHWNRFSDAVEASGTDISLLEPVRNPYDPFVSSVSRLKEENRSHVVSRIVMTEDPSFSTRTLSDAGIRIAAGGFCIVLANFAKDVSEDEIIGPLENAGIICTPFDSDFSVSFIANAPDDLFPRIRQELDADEDNLYYAVSKPVNDVRDLHKAFLQASNIMEYRKSVAMSETGGEGYALYRAALSEIETNFGDSQLNVSLIADRLGVSIVYLSKCFKKHGEKNPSDYLTGFRITRAKEILSDPDRGNLSMNDIASECGFGSTRTFMRVFKASEGVAPGQFKAGVRNMAKES